MSDTATAITPLTPAPSRLWFAHRTAYEAGTGFCAMARYLGNHFGPSGTGIQRKAQSIPLATGSYTHDGLRVVLEWCRDNDQEAHRLAVAGEVPVPPHILSLACTHAVTAYKAVVAARGLHVLADEARLDEIIQEQSCLIEGLIRVWTRFRLAPILVDSRIVYVETEEVLVLECTCGLGAMIGTQAMHDARGCEGIAWQTRADFLTVKRAAPQMACYHEFKTAGQTGENFKSRFETKVQMTSSGTAYEKRYGLQVTEVMVHALVKGRREGDDWNPDTQRREGVLRQQSVLCYGWYRPAQPPVSDEDWAPSFKYKGADGRNHTLGKAYEKRGIWALEAVAAQLGKTAVELWIDHVPEEQLRKLCEVVGPLNPQEILKQEFWQEVTVEEQEWREKVAASYMVLEECGFDWTTPRFQDHLRQTYHRSWACRTYGFRHACQFELICFKKEGWTDPLGGASPLYVVRRPHHQPELDQAIGSGALLPEAGVGEDEGEED